MPELYCRRYTGGTKSIFTVVSTLLPNFSRLLQNCYCWYSGSNKTVNAGTVVILKHSLLVWWWYQHCHCCYSVGTNNDCCSINNINHCCSSGDTNIITAVTVVGNNTITAVPMTVPTISAVTVGVQHEDMHQQTLPDRTQQPI